MTEHAAASPADDHAVRVRQMGAGDVPAFLELIQALADYERLPGPDPAARARLALDAVAEPPPFFVLLAERGGRAIGYALYFMTYSTFLARPSLYLEDIFVLERERRHGVGHALMRALAREAVARGCGRMEWQVLKWNAPAIEFYRGLGAAPLDDWVGYRLTAEQIQRIAEEP
ncbi:MAG TPA: GNAT family N-acetyltransferase [Chloroflexota bacterium]|nr:GNAT family N-acetyltransferase [Chloroflexota bacterium]